jgi:UV DNA damage repair endonuclease
MTKPLVLRSAVRRVSKHERIFSRATVPQRSAWYGGALVVVERR